MSSQRAPYHCLHCREFPHAVYAPICGMAKAKQRHLNGVQGIGEERAS